MNEEETRSWLHLLRAPNVGAPEIRTLIDAYGSAAAAVGAGPRAWGRLPLPRGAVAGLQAVDESTIDADLAWLRGAADRGLLPYTDPRYPQRLLEIGSPPPALFYVGDAGLLGLPQIAIVGARSATPQGLENALAFAEALAARGLVVTSGLALGIDGQAHRGALAAGGSTIAVCGTGLDRVYPARHKDLAHAIAGTGLLISEFLPGTAAIAEHFPRRNRIISGLSLGVLVVEAARESGSLITARLAADQGREVFAIPGSIHNPLSRGCHQLIRQGAKLVENVEDIFLELADAIEAILRADRPAPAAAEPADEPETAGPAHELQAILQAMGRDPVTLDRLIQRLGWPADKVGSLLMQAELSGWVASDVGGRYVRLKAGA